MKETHREPDFLRSVSNLLPVCPNGRVLPVLILPTGGAWDSANSTLNKLLTNFTARYAVAVLMHVYGPFGLYIHSHLHIKRTN